MASLVPVRGAIRPVKRECPRDMVVSGLDRVELVGGGLVRFTMFVEMPVFAGRKAERLPADWDVVMPVAAVPDSIGKTLFAIGRTVVVRGDGSLIVGH